MLTSGKGRHQLVASIGAHSHEATRAQGHLAAVPNKDIKTNRCNRVDQKGHQDRIRPVIIDDKGMTKNATTKTA